MSITDQHKEDRQKINVEHVSNPDATRRATRRAANALYLIVFVSGAVLMGVEIAGAKVLAPGFGTSTFVWGSIIGLFMGALAAGYYLGGMLADKHPSFTTLATIVSMAGLWTAFVIPRFGPNICDWVARKDIGPVFGPLIAAGIIFFLPSFLMGTVAPYAVKLNAGSLSGLGGVAGRLYALSTCGSIIGTLLTTFILIPKLFVSDTMQGLGLLLTLVAISSLFLFLSAMSKLSRTDHVGIGVMAFIALLVAETWIVFPIEPRSSPGSRLLHYEDSAYHEILVTEDVAQARDDERDNILLPICLWKPDDKERPWWLYEVRRWLKFNDNIESGIHPYRAHYSNAVGYTDLLHLPLLWLNNPLPQKILVVGGGGGVIPTQYSSWYNSQIDVAEIDPVVERIAKTYFQIPKTDKIRFYIGDGRQTVKQTLDNDYDLIVLDAYSSGGQIPFHLLTWEFLNNVKSKLSRRGILATNIISGIRNIDQKAAIKPADLFLAEYKTLSASRAQALRVKSDNPADNEPLFKQIYVFPKIREGTTIRDTFEEYRNVIVIATMEETRLTIEKLEEIAQQLTAGNQRVVKTDLLPHVRQLYEPRADDLKNMWVLTDDFAPVDLMYRPVRRDETLRKVYWY